MPGQLIFDRTTRRAVDTHLNADRTENDRDIEGSGCPDQKPDVEFNLIRPSLRFHVLKHFLLVVDQDQGHILGGPNSFYFMHLRSPHSRGATFGALEL